MSGLVDKVLIEDESPRDSLQIETRLFSAEEKLHVIRGTEACGFRRIQVGSFAPGAAGNVATEDAVHALAELGVETARRSLVGPAPVEDHLSAYAA